MNRVVITLKRWASRLAGSAGLGVLATVVDFAVLTGLVELAGLAPAIANIPALACGAAVQFVGCRYLVFRARAGSFAKQLGGFAATELGTVALNGLAFHLFVTFTSIPYPIARVVGTFLVFAGFSFPLWTLVFRGRAAVDR
jgi:putative flippase GtrA